MGNCPATLTAAECAQLNYSPPSSKRVYTNSSETVAQATDGTVTSVGGTVGPAVTNTSDTSKASSTGVVDQLFQDVGLLETYWWVFAIVAVVVVIIIVARG